MLRRRCRVVMDEEYVQEHILTGGIVAPVMRGGDRPFRQIRIERARTDIFGFGQLRSRKFLGLSLVAKSFGRPWVPSLRPWQTK